MKPYQKEYKITSYECDRRNVLRLRTLFNLFQDLADNHADEMGLGYRFCAPRHIGWIGGAYHVEIQKWPKWNDCVMLQTWPSKSTGVTGIREFLLTDETGRSLITATSQWVLIDTEKVRPISVEKNVGTYELIPTRAVESSFEKLPAPERVDFSALQIIRQDDIDLYGHVNNAVYPTWILDALPDDFIATHQPQSLQIQFKRSAKKGDTILVETQKDGLETVHCVTDGTGGSEFARLKIVWRQID